jgi:hypothetical protein
MNTQEKQISRNRCPWVNQIGVQCGQPEGHYPSSHGNGLLTTGRDTWKLQDAEEVEIPR